MSLDQGALKLEVRVYNELTYHSNELTFEELDAAIKYAQDLYRRWALVEDWGVVDQDGQVLAVKPS